MQTVGNRHGLAFHGIPGGTDGNLGDVCLLGGDMQLHIPQTDPAEGVEEQVFTGLCHKAEGEMTVATGGTDTQILQMLTESNQYLGGFINGQLQLGVTNGVTA